LVATTTAIAGAFFWIKHQVKRFTVTEPVSLPIYSLPDAELELIKDRAKLFYDLLKAGRANEADDFFLTQDESNAFIAHSDYFRGNAYMHVANNVVSVELSLPAEGFPGGKGRYFVGSGFVKVAVEKTEDDGTLITTKLDTSKPIDGLNGSIFFAKLLGYMASDGTYNLNVESGNFLNWIVPQDYIDEKENLLKDLYDSDETAPVVKAIKSISVEDSQITIHVRRDAYLVKEEESGVEVTKSYYGGTRRLLTKLLF
jgi:hypothetical protein